MRRVSSTPLVVAATIVGLSFTACTSDDDASPTTSATSGSDTTSTTSGTTTQTSGTSTSSGDTATTTAGTTATAAVPAPSWLASQVLAPDGLTYVSQSPIDTSGYWTSYAIPDGSDAGLDEYENVLTTIGWTIGDSSESAITATRSAAWLDVLVVEAATGDTVSVCVWNAEPAADACSDFPTTLLESTAPATTVES